MFYLASVFFLIVCFLYAAGGIFSSIVDVTSVLALIFMVPTVVAMLLGFIKLLRNKDSD